MLSICLFFWTSDLKYAYKLYAYKKKSVTICAITAWIERYKSIIKKKNKKHDKIALLARSKLNSIEVLISKASIDSYISHDEFVSINNLLTQYYEMKEEIKNPETSVEYII